MNALIFNQLVNNQLPDSSAILNFVLMNAAAALFIAGQCNSYKEGVAIAKESISQGKLKSTFESFRLLSNNSSALE